MADEDNKFKLKAQLGADEENRVAQRDVDISKGKSSVLDEADFGASSVFREREKERRNINKERLRKRAIMRAYRSDLRHGGEGNKLRAVARLAELGLRPDAGIRQHGEDAIEAGKRVREAGMEAGDRNRAKPPNKPDPNRPGRDDVDRDFEGNDMAGFNKDGIHKDTGTKYDERGLDKDGNPKPEDTEVTAPGGEGGGTTGPSGPSGDPGDPGDPGDAGPTPKERRTLQGLRLEGELEDAGVSPEDWSRIQAQNPEFQTEAEKRRLLVQWKRQNNQGRKPLKRGFRGFDRDALGKWKENREADKAQELEDERILSGRRAGLNQAQLDREKVLPEMLERSRRLVRTIPADRYDELVEQNPEKYLPRQPGVGRWAREGAGGERYVDRELGQKLADEAVSNPSLRDLPPNEFWATMQRLKELATPRDQMASVRRDDGTTTWTEGKGSLSEDVRISREASELAGGIEASEAGRQRQLDYFKAMGGTTRQTEGGETVVAEEGAFADPAKLSHYYALGKATSKEFSAAMDKWSASDIKSKKAIDASQETLRKRLEEIRGRSK